MNGRYDNYTNIEALKDDAEFNRLLMITIVDEIINKKYPDYRKKGKERTLKAVKAGYVEKITDRKVLEAKTLRDKLKDLGDPKALKKFCEDSPDPDLQY